MTRLLRVAVVSVVAAAALLASAGMAAAHPLGNFSVNRHSGLVASPGLLRIDHVLDLAEIPTAQARAQLDQDGDTAFGAGELASWSASRCAQAAKRMDVAVDGRRVPIVVRTATAGSAVGQAGLPTLRVECKLAAGLPQSSQSLIVRFEDRAARDQVGWREVTARGDGTTLLDSDVPTSSRSARLTSYPQDLLNSPPDERGARLRVRPGGPRLQEDTGAAAAAPPRFTDRLAQRVGSLVTGDLTLLTMVVALVLAVVVGAVHAIAPGHGKTMVAFYLASRDDSRMRSGLIVAATVTATHTAGVLGLGLLVTAGTALAPERAYPWLTLVSALVVTGVGVLLFRQAAARPTSPARPEPVGVHADARGDAHVHRHPHPHEDQPFHDGAPGHVHPPLARPGGAGLIAMGLAGGLLPSPSALVVLLATVAVGKPWLGLLLVTAFGIGMAATLSATALLATRIHDYVLRAESLSGGRVATMTRALPLLLAGTVVGLGLMLLSRALAALSA